MIKQGKLQFLFLFMFIPLAAQTSSVTSDGYLRDWQYDGDHVIFSTENGTINSVMTADEERLVLRKYDDSHRLVSEVVWSQDYETIVSETEWTYPAKGVHPESMTKRLMEQKQKVCVLYSSAGLETERTIWNTDGEGSESIAEKTVWQYDGEKRVTRKTHEVYAAGVGAAARPTLVERTEYSYTDKADEPDMLYYENDVLVEKMEYAEDGSYTDSLYFEDMEIRSVWKDGLKLDEVYYLDGKEVKRKSL